LPSQPESQLERIVTGLRRTLGDGLVGVYLHGSLVLGCFNPARSDVDLLVVTRERLLGDERARVLDFLRGESGSYDQPGWPRPVEVSTLALDDLRPWRYPTPYDLHVSSSSPAGGGPGDDHDLAAHVWILIRRGRVLDGLPIADVFPDVPYADYLDSLERDFASCRAEGYAWARYAILSMTRVWAAQATGEVHSKESGALRALERLPDDLRPLVEQALESYRGDGHDFPVDRDQFKRLAGYVDAELRR
jgi:streptomycin 3"-adenylyltransferase